MNRFALTPLVTLVLPLVACREAGLEPDGLAAARSPSGTVAVEETLVLPVRSVAIARATSCNSPAPSVALEGKLEQNGLGSRLTFRTGGGGTPETQAQEDASLLSEGDGVDVRRQAIEANVEPEPYVWVKFYDENGTALSEEIFLGRCSGQGFTKQIAVEFTLPVQARADIAVSQCDHSTGPLASVGGDMALQRAVIAKLIFDDTNEPGSHETTADLVVEVQYAPAGSEVRFAREQIRAGIGGDPSISFTYLDAEGQPIGEEQTLGSCSQLAA